MTFEEYHERAEQTANYPEKFSGSMIALAYVALGLTGEAGEFSNKIKKIIRDNNMQITEDLKKSLIGELGDCLWYLSAAAKELDVSLEDVAVANLEKLESRKRRNKLGGSGDNR